MKKDETLSEALESESTQLNAKNKGWAELVETSVLDFFSAYKFEKLSVEDDCGNKAKLSKTKDDSVKIELSSTSII